MANRPYVKHFRTTGSTAPDAELIQDGEIAIAKDNESPKLFIKKNDGTVAEFVDSKVVDAKITQGKSDAIASAASQAQAKVDDAIKVEKERAEAAEKANTDAIAAINNEETGILKLAKDEAAAKKTEAIDAAAADATAKADAAKNAAISAASTETAQQIADLNLAGNYAAKSTVDTLVGADTNKSIRVIASEELAKQLIPENAKESLDSLTEIATWIQKHPEDAAAMNSAIKALETLAEGLNQRLVVVEMAINQDEYEGDAEGYEMVDLGLPSGLKWAKCNIGADKETDYGMYFKFGDVVGHGAQNCNHDDSIPAVEVDDNNHLRPAYDAATQLMGAAYRMPTKEEMDELINNTDHSVMTIDGVSGMRYSKKGDANTYIFVPFAGYCLSGSFYLAGSYGYLWSSTLSDDNNAYELDCYNNGNTRTNYGSRNFGFSVRGVSE